MEHDPVVRWISVMSMGVPVPLMEMNLDISPDLMPADPDPGASKVRSSKQIPLTGALDLERAPVEQARRCDIKISVHPDLLDDAFRERERTVESLDLVELVNRTGHGVCSCRPGPATKFADSTQRKICQSCEPKFTARRRLPVGWQSGLSRRS